jgi:PAS domain S-box-containing protein
MVKPLPSKKPNRDKLAGRYDAVFRYSQMAIGIARLADGRYVDANPAFLRLFGYRRGDVIGRTSKELGLWPVPSERAELMRRLRAGESVTAYVAHYQSRDGRVGQVSISARLIELDGEPHLVGMLIDITERKRVEAALRESEARLRMALSAARLPVFHQDRNLRYTWIANPALGLGSEDIVGHTDDELLGPATAAPLVGIKKRVLRQGRGARQEIWLERAGQTGCFDLIVEPERDDKGRIVGVLCTADDITERKQSEASLRMQADILATLQEGVNLVDGKGLILYTNAAFDRLFGYAPGELIGQHASVLNAPDEASPEEVARAILGGLQRTGRWTGDIANRRKDGSVFWTRANIAAVRHPTMGRVWVSMQSDITEMRRLMDERGAVHHALERLSDHVQDEMEALRREIAREVHDEIGAALTGIGMRLEAKLRDHGNMERRNLNDLRELRRQVDQALKRTRELCGRLRPPILDDLGLVETCRWYLRDWSRQTGLRVRGRLDNALADPDDRLRTDLFRIFQELLTNVARHAGASRVDVSLKASGKGLRLRVRDDGRGFTAGKPAGIGLVGIRERLRRHGGRMTIDSGESGSVVSIDIPMQTP